MDTAVSSKRPGSSISGRTCPEDEDRREFVDTHFMVRADAECCLPQGFGGDARKANKEKGRFVNQFVIEALTDLVRQNFEG